MRFIRWTGFALGLLVLAALCTAIVARLSDGPIQMFPGGKLYGRSADGPVRDWSFLGGRRTVEIEVNPTDPRSVRTSFIVHEGAVYIPALLAEWQTWPLLAEQDERVLLRVDGRLYPLKAVRVTDPAELRTLVRDIDRRFSGGSDDPAKLTTWYFRLEPRR